MNLDSKLVQKTLQSLLTDVTQKVLTTPTPDISSVALLTTDRSNDKHERKRQEDSTIKKRNENVNFPTPSIDPAVTLYEKLDSAYKEFSNKKNRECFKFQESVINIESQVPHPETFSEKFLSREMREHIKNNSKKTLTFKCNIHQRPIQLCFILFKKHVTVSCDKDSVSYYKTYAHRVFMWLYMISLHSNCVETLSIYVYLTPFKKKLPENKSEIISPINANTGYTYRCDKKNEIVIYREEEWFKVLLHETIHAFGNDFNHDIVDMNIDTTYLKQIFSLPPHVDVQLSETYSEIWARIMNVAFQTYFKNPPSLESRTAKQFKKNFYFYLHLESIFSLYQCIKILDFMGINYQILTDDSEHSKKMMRIFYRENTHVFAYYVLTSILLHSHHDFLSWCIKNNGPGLYMFKVRSTEKDFAKFIASCYKKNDLLQKIVETEKKVMRDFEKAISDSSNNDDTQQLVTTLRMTIVGFD
jgi:hypothetical protein